MKVLNNQFVDELNRTLTLRGVNLSGNIKNPTNTTSKETHTHDISFTNRPFPIDEAHVHFARLKSWGFNIIRYCVTWEALEHQGPTNYDDKFIDYLVKILEIGSLFKFKFFIDPHQDTWSRFTGGSGAPYWTLQVVGFNPDNFYACGAALTHEDWLSNYHTPLPKMIWPSNYNKLACATMFTLFFAGNTFAPNCVINFHKYSQTVHEFLVESFLNAFGYLFYRIKLSKLDCVIGFDSFNEPSEGFIGCKLNQIATAVQVHKHNSPTIIQGMKLGNGIKQSVTYYSSFGLFNVPSSATIDPDGKSVWLENPVHPSNLIKPIEHSDIRSRFVKFNYNHLESNNKLSMSWSGCIWKHHKVYNDLDYVNDYFVNYNGSKVDFDTYWMRFVELECSLFRREIPGLICFLEPPVLKAPPQSISKSIHPLCLAPHWYDGITLMTKSFPLVQINAIKYLRGDGHIMNCLFMGTNGIRQCFTDQVKQIKDDTPVNVPCLLGETGLAFDIHDKWMMISSDESLNNFAYDCYFRAFEKNLMHFTLWHYNPNNTWHTDDQWNDENLSIFATKMNPPIINKSECLALLGMHRKGEKFDFNELFMKLNKDGRCLQSMIRPYAYCTPGTPLHIRFNYKTHYFSYHFMPDIKEIGKTLQTPAYLTTCKIKESTTCEIYLPRYHYSSFYGYYNKFKGTEYEELIEHLQKNGWDVFLSQGVFWLNELEQKLIWACNVYTNQTTKNPKDDNVNDVKIHPEKCSIEIQRHKVLEKAVKWNDLGIMEKAWHLTFGDDYGYTPSDYGRFCTRK
eukprot:NODE_275_length_12088_cov_0.250813.p1 type:complete len:791 gc:universal NODE_275_length_12088_cov_0.250813:8865-6493(-)